MDRSDEKSNITFSGSNFYQKINEKYQTGKFKNSSFPRMIFYKNLKCSSLQTINVTIRLQLHMNSQIKMLSLVKHLVPNTVKHTSYLYKKPLLISSNPAFYQQTSSRIPSNNLIVNPQISNHESNIKILNSQVFRNVLNYRSLNSVKHTSYLEKNTRKDQYKLPSVLSQDNLLKTSINPNIWLVIYKGSISNLLKSELYRNSLFLNSTKEGINKLTFKELKYLIVNKPFEQNHYGSFGYFEYDSTRRAYSYKTDAESLHFQDSKRLEDEIEQIKKIVIQTKESILEKLPRALGEADIKRHLDLNRISDQVYQNLERRIRMERERRGI